MYRATYELADMAPGMGSWLSSLFKCTGLHCQCTGVNCVPQVTQDQIDAQVMGQVVALLKSQGKVVTDNAALHKHVHDEMWNVTGSQASYSAIQTDPNVTTIVVNATIADLTADGKISDDPSYVAPQPGALTASLSNITSNPQIMLIGAAGLMAFAVMSLMSN